MTGHITTWLGFLVAAPGALLLMIGALGMLRFKDPYARAHASVLVVSVGPALAFLGLAISAWEASLSSRFAVLAALSIALGPFLSHVAGAAVYASGADHGVREDGAATRAGDI